jgi:hypothetical protein
MDSRRLNDSIQIATGFAIVLGLAFVIWELNQNREATKSQLTSDGWGQIGQQNASVVGEGLAQVIAKACEKPEELTTTDLVVLEAHIEEQINAIWRIRSLATEGSFYDDSEMQKNVGLLNRVLSTHPGRTYFRKIPWLPSDIRIAINESLPSIVPCNQFFGDWKSSIAESEVRGRLDPALGDLENWFNRYAALWLEPTVVDIPEIMRHYITPIHFVDESGVGFISSNSELDSRYRRLLENPSDNHYSGDVLVMSEVTILSETSARVEADWMGLDKDRNPMGCFGRSYSLIRTGDDWKISGFSLRSCIASSEL